MAPGAFAGSRGHLRVAPSGAVLSAEWTFPAGLDARAQTAARAAVAGVEQLFPRFPDVPIGPGARWRVASDWDAGPLSLGVVHVWSVAAEDATGATLGDALSATVPSGALDLGPDAPITTSVTAVSASGSTTVHLPAGHLVGARTGDLTVHAELSGSKGPVSVDLVADVAQHQVVTVGP